MRRSRKPATPPVRESTAHEGQGPRLDPLAPRRRRRILENVGLPHGPQAVPPNAVDSFALPLKQPLPKRKDISGKAADWKRPVPTHSPHDHAGDHSNRQKRERDHDPSDRAKVLRLGLQLRAQGITSTANNYSRRGRKKFGRSPKESAKQRTARALRRKGFAIKTSRSHQPRP
jgi:hypothetical protein